MDKLREGEDDQITRSRSPQMLSRVGPAKAREKEFGHGDKAREGAHRTEALQDNVDTQRGMIRHEVWGVHRAM